jgi:Fic family protein
MAVWPVELMEPMRVSEQRDDGQLAELAAQLIRLDTQLEATMPKALHGAVAELVRSMNCYYSNLIEGHNTRPREIDRALSQNYSEDPAMRELQEEAKAHIEVQRLIDRDQAPSVPVTSWEWLSWCHREFYERLPPAFRLLKTQSGVVKEEIVPGALRKLEVTVGSHQPPPAEDLERFLLRFHEAYNPDPTRLVRGVAALGASHHRLLWIHPFPDGNGRVARLFSHAYLRSLGLCGGSLWSVSRGLARQKDVYKQMLAHADADRRNDLDGRGNLSEEALMDLSRFFLERVAIDQARYMASLLQPATVRDRVMDYTRDEMTQKRLPPGSDRLMLHALTYGGFERSQMEDITGYSDRYARDALRSLLEKRLLASESPRAKHISLNFPAEAAERWFPDLFAVGAAER